MTTFHKQNTRPPVRPYQLQDEWYETYLGRVIRANGVKAPWRYDLDRLRLVLTPQGCSGGGEPEYSGEQLPAWFVYGRGAQIRYCPQCLEEARYVRSRWRLVTFEACTLHKTILKSGLCEPAITSMYQAPGKKYVDEISSEEMWEGSACPTPVALQYVDAVWSEFERRVEGLKPGDPAEPLAWALLAERLLDAVVKAVRGIDYPARSVLRLHHRANWLAKTELNISATKEGIWQFLSGIKMHTQVKAAIRTLATLQRDEQRQKTVMSRLPLKEFHDRLLALSLETGLNSYCGALPRAMHPDGFVSLDRTEAILECSPSFLYFLVREGFFNRIERIKWGKKQYIFIHTSDVEACRRWLASTMSYEHVLSQLCIDRKAYWLLLECGILRPIQLDSWTRHRREDISRVTDSLDSIACPYCSNIFGEQSLLGAWWQKKGVTRTAVIQVLKEVWDGRHRVYRKLDERGLAAYYVDFSVVERLHRITSTHASEKNRAQRAEGQLTLLGMA